MFKKYSQRTIFLCDNISMWRLSLWRFRNNIIKDRSDISFKFPKISKCLKIAFLLQLKQSTNFRTKKLVISKLLFIKPLKWCKITLINFTILLLVSNLKSINSDVETLELSAEYLGFHSFWWIKTVFPTGCEKYHFLDIRP